MEKETLSDKIIFGGRKECPEGEDHAVIVRRDVKEKIQNAQRRLKEENILGRKMLIEVVDKIFLS